MSEKKENILPEGVRVFMPHANAPDFVKGTVVVSLNDFFQFCEDNPDYLSEYDGKKQLRLQILESKDGEKLYATVDTYKKEAAPKENKKDEKKGGKKDKLPF